MRSRRALLFACLTVLVVVPFPARGEPSIEAELLSLVNGGRPSTLIAHSGLRSVARGHSEQMAADGHMSHDGAEQRVRSADPDPAEANGAPDDGETGRWCENVAYVSGAPDDEVAHRIYEGWQNSPSHNRCMTDGEMNAAGVGLHFDGKTWWATMELIVDRTPPGSAQPSAAGTAPEPTSTPESVAGGGASPSEAPSLPVPTVDAGELSDSAGTDPVRTSETTDVPRIASPAGERPAGVPPQAVAFPSRSAAHNGSDGGGIAVAAIFFVLASVAVVAFRTRARRTG